VFRTRSQIAARVEELVSDEKRLIAEPSARARIKRALEQFPVTRPTIESSGVGRVDRHMT
jgi:hypothetical protein